MSDQKKMMGFLLQKIFFAFRNFKTVGSTNLPNEKKIAFFLESQKINSACCPTFKIRKGLISKGTVPELKGMTF